jgi:DNA modification methylase
MVTIHTGDCLDVLRTMEAESVQCCVTSPPYFGLRDYGHAGQIGLEPTPADYVSRLVAVFAEVRRVLKDDGTLWLNLGDSYAGSWGAQSREHAGKHAPNISALSANQVKAAAIRTNGTGSLGRTPGLKAKDLIGIPWRVAFALQAAGWYLRSDIIWHKPNPMPESVADRCTKAHEYLFMLAKSERYYFDADAIKDPVAETSVDRAKYSFDSARERMNNAAPGAGKNMRNDQLVPLDGMRNKRTVWSVATSPYAEAHFATFPPELIRPCILAGCPKGGTVLDPFGGSGTTGEVSEQEGRHSVLIELNPEYVALAQRRTSQTGLLHSA